MLRDLYLDLETRCAVPIKHGTYKYARAAEIILWSWGYDDDDIELWDVQAGDPMPELLRAGLCDSRVRLIAHEAQFDRVVLSAQREFYGIPEEAFDISRWWCTAAQARAHSMPGGLEKLCGILGIPTAEAKMPDCKPLVKLFTTPRQKRQGGGFVLPGDEPEKWEQFKDYCVLDTVAMRAVRRRLPQWNYGERGGRSGETGLRRWHLDQRMNDRGFAVDVTMAEQAVEAVARERERINARGQELTGVEDLKMTQRDLLLRLLLEEFGVDLPNMQASTLERRIEDENLPDEVRELLALRLQASTASVAKYQALLRSVTDDGRLHGTGLYCGAGRTGRKAGRLFQHQNLSRVPKHLVKIYDVTAESIRTGAIDLAPPIEVKKDGTVVHHSAMETMGYMVRGAVIAAPGKKLCIADLSNIEGRMMAYLSGEEWKLKAFREYDLDPDNMEKDLYVLAYANSFKVSPYSVVQDYKEGGILRQIGKVQELALQYWGGLRAAKKMAALYGVELPDARWNEIVALWREANANIMRYSGDLERAWRKAIYTPGLRIPVGKYTAVQRDGSWLRVRLPSGRMLCYPSPQIDADDLITYMGVNAYSRKWERIGTYGGKQGENVVQAASGDVLFDNEEVIEQAGYDLVMDVHDETVTETPDTPEFSGKHLSSLLSSPLPYLPGFPLASKGSETKRYRKD